MLCLKNSIANSLLENYITLSEPAGQLLMQMLFNLIAVASMLMNFLLWLLITPYQRTALLRIGTEQHI